MKLASLWTNEDKLAENMKCRDVDNKKGIILFSYFPIFLISNSFTATQDTLVAYWGTHPSYQQAANKKK